MRWSWSLEIPYWMWTRLCIILGISILLQRIVYGRNTRDWLPDRCSIIWIADRKKMKDQNDGVTADEDLNNKLFENLTLSAEHFVKRGQHRIASYVELSRCKSQQFAGNYSVVMEYIGSEVSANVAFCPQSFRYTEPSSGMGSWKRLCCSDLRQPDSWLTAQVSYASF